MFEPLKFKSYYVVWKQSKSDNFVLGECSFKSYYVVWKPKVKNEEKGKSHV